MREIMVARKNPGLSRDSRDFLGMFSLVGHRLDTRKYTENEVGKVGPEGRHSLLALTSYGPSVVVFTLRHRRHAGGR